MREFVFQSTQKIIFGEKSIKNVLSELKNIHVNKPFFICDPNVRNLPFFESLIKDFIRQEIEFGIFSDIESDPSYETADNATKAILDFKSDSVIGIGGGSALDIAKIVAITSKTKESVKQLMSKPNISDNGLPLILIPTTAGTGSEVTHISILSNNTEQTKNGLVSPKLYADVAILDPEITLSLPKHITAYSGIDAIIHALEAFTSKQATELTNMLALEALNVLFSNIFTAFTDGQNIEARSKMLYGSMIAGKAFANSSVAAVHAFAYPIGAEYHIPHGLANSIMLIPILKYNIDSEIEKYALAAKAIGVDTKDISKFEAANQLILELDELLINLKLERKLRFYGVKILDIPRLAEKVMKITRLMDNNPKKITLQIAKRLYMEAF